MKNTYTRALPLEQHKQLRKNELELIQVILGNKEPGK